MSELATVLRDWGEFGWGAVVLGLVWMLFSGRLATSRELQDRDKQLAFLQETNRELAAGSREAAEAIRTNNALLQAILDRSRGERP